MNVKLTKKAHERLTLVAKFSNMTPSDAILYFIPEEYAHYPPKSVKDGEEK